MNNRNNSFNNFNQGYSGLFQPSNQSGFTQPWQSNNRGNSNFNNRQQQRYDDDNWFSSDNSNSRNNSFELPSSNFNQRTIWQTDRNSGGFSSSRQNNFGSNSPWGGGGGGGGNPAWLGNYNSNNGSYWDSSPRTPKPLFMKSQNRSWGQGRKRPVAESTPPAAADPKKPRVRNQTRKKRGGGAAGTNLSTATATPSQAEKKKQPQSAPVVKTRKWQPQKPLGVQPGEIEALVVIDGYPIKRLTPEQFTDLSEKFKVEQKKMDPDEKFFRVVEPRKGRLWVVLTNKEAVEVLKKIVADLPPIEDLKIRLMLPNKKEDRRWLAILSDGFPTKFLAFEQLRIVENSLLERINKIAEDAFRPELMEVLKKRGSLFICCNNELSLKWVKNTIPELKAVEGDQLKMMDPMDLPVYCKLQMVLPCKEDEVDKMLERLDRQNEGLNTPEWFLIRKEAVPDGGTSIFVSTAKKVHDHIKKQMNNRIFINFSTIKVWFNGFLKVKYPVKFEKTEEENGKEDSTAKVEDTVKTEVKTE